MKGSCSRSGAEEREGIGEEGREKGTELVAQQALLQELQVRRPAHACLFSFGQICIDLGSEKSCCNTGVT